MTVRAIPIAVVKFECALELVFVRDEDFASAVCKRVILALAEVEDNAYYDEFVQQSFFDPADATIDYGANEIYDDIADERSASPVQNQAFSADSLDGEHGRGRRLSYDRRGGCSSSD